MLNTLCKFQRLLQIAIKEGYTPHNSICNWLVKTKTNPHIQFDISGLSLNFNSDRWCDTCSINDIVLDYEQESDDISFVKALCRASRSAINCSDIVKAHNYKQIRINWSTTPNSDRLDYLFAQFVHFF